MPTSTLVVVHGMGQHSADSVAKEVNDAFTAAFSFYASLNSVPPKEMFNVVPVTYNDILDDFRQKLSAQAGNLAAKIGALDGPLTIDVAKEITGIEAELGSDSFFNTHWLDVILYRYMLINERVRLRVAAAVATAIKDVGSSRVHVLGHSLGSSVVHDALAKSYGPENLQLPGGGTVLNLSPTTHRLGSIHMVANVSRALQTFVKVGSSIVRPGPLGCASVFAEYRHKLDPIPKIRPFNPTDNGGWVPHDVFSSVYLLKEPSAVTAANVHSLGHYLVNPEVHLGLFRLLFGFRPKKSEREAGEGAYTALTLEDKARALQNAFGDFSPTDQDSVKALLTAAKALKNMIEGFGESF